MTYLLNITWFILLIILVVASLLPPPSNVPSFDHMDKVMHFAAYAFMTFLPAYFLEKRMTLVKIGIFLLLLGIGIEYAQSFVPRRTPSFYDFLANTVGIIVGLGTGKMLSLLRASRV